MGIVIRDIRLETGLHTFGEVGGTNHTLLMLHGFAFRQGLHPFMDVLQSHFRVITPELPFSNRSLYSNGHTLENYVDTLLDFIDRLGLGRVTLFGNSVGGTLGLMCCLKAPHRFNKLVVRCPLWSQAQLPFYLRLGPLVALHGWLSGIQPYAAWALRTFYLQSARMSPTEVENASVPCRPATLDQVEAPVLSRFLGHLVQVEITARLPAIETETLILWGESDRFVKPPWGIRLAESLPKAHYQGMPGEYHNIATADPQSLAKIITRFALP
jgi:pimeloyl-ACP methyl ester carboxylesterase